MQLLNSVFKGKTHHTITESLISELRFLNSMPKEKIEFPMYGPQLYSESFP